MDKKPTGDGKVLAAVPKMLGKDGLRIMTQVINDMYEIWDCPMDFIEVTMIALKKKLNATKCSHHHKSASQHIQPRQYGGYLNEGFKVKLSM